MKLPYELNGKVNNSKKQLRFNENWIKVLTFGLLSLTDNRSEEKSKSVNGTNAHQGDSYYSLNDYTVKKV